MKKTIAFRTAAAASALGLALTLAACGSNGWLANFRFEGLARGLCQRSRQTRRRELQDEFGLRGLEDCERSGGTTEMKQTTATAGFCQLSRQEELGSGPGQLRVSSASGRTGSGAHDGMR